MGIPKSNVMKKGNTTEPMLRGRGGLLLGAAAIVALTAVAYLPAMYAGYIWDDDIQLRQSQLIQTTEGLYKIWFTTQAPDYWPLTSTTFWIEWRIWGDNPSPYHVTNIVLHALAAVVLWRVLKRIGFNSFGAFVGGMLFAVHPVNVASAAWIAERKNVLSMVLYLLSIHAYLRFEDQRCRRWYVIALCAAVATLLAKTSVVALPVVLLLLCWRRNRAVTWRDLLNTLPFFALSLVLGLATVWFQHHNAIAGGVVRPEGIASRIASVGWVFWFYLYKIALPINLVMIYPRWDIDGGRVASFVPLALMVVCFFILWYYRKSWGSGSLVALGSFVVVLAPVLGMLDMAYAIHSLVADHLQYPGMPGIIALVSGVMGAAWARAQRNNSRTPAVRIAALAGGIILVSTVLTWQQARFYKNEASLWTHNLQLNKRAWMAYNNRGNAYGDMGDDASAIEDYTRAIEIKPDLAQAYSNRGSVYSRHGDYGRAVQDFSKAIEIKPDYGSAYYNRGTTYSRMGDFARAIQDFTRAIELKPGFADAYNNRGAAYFNLEKYAEEVRDCTQAIAIKPDFADAYKNRAVAFLFLQEFDKSWVDVKMCRRLGGVPHPDFIKTLSEASGRTE